MAPNASHTDVDDVLRGIVKNAIGYAAAKSENGDVATALVKAARDDSWVRFYATHGCAEGIAEYFGEHFAEVSEVYVAGLEGDEEIGQFYPVIVAVCAASRSDKLDAAAEEIEANLPRFLAKAAGFAASTARNTINVRIVDSSEVKARSGFGALIGSLWAPPIRLWPR